MFGHHGVLERVRRCGHARGSVLLGVGFSNSKAQARPSDPCFLLSADPDVEVEISATSPAPSLLHGTMLLAMTTMD